MERQTDGWMEGKTDRQTKGQTTDGQMDRYIDGQTYRLANEPTNGQTDSHDL